MSAWWEPQEPRGHDPYNTHASAAVMSRELAAEMERIWRKCIVATTPAPIFIIPSAGFMDAYYDHLATPDRGHEFEPYARG